MTLPAPHFRYNQAMPVKKTKADTSTKATARDFASVKLLILDVDGVLTDGGVYYGAEGEQLKRFFIPDGMGLVLLQRAGIPVAVMTTENSPRVTARIKQLKLAHYAPGISKKGEHLPRLCAEAGVDPKHAAYVGDDVNDVSALKQVGLPIGTRDCMDEVRAVVRYVTKAAGGNGAVREVANLILKAKGVDIPALWERG